MRTQKEKKYITLKEAADMSGYASDYVGQLIRSGKLEGKQVYNAVAWMTTEEAVREYMQRAREKVSLNPLSSGVKKYFQLFKNGLLFSERSTKVLNFFLYLIIGLSVLIGLLLFYILSVNIESKLQQQAEEKLQLRSLETYAEQ